MSAHCTSAITPKEKSGRCSGFAVGIDILILAQWERADAHSIVVDPGERMRIAPRRAPRTRSAAPRRGEMHGSGGRRECHRVLARPKGLYKDFSPSSGRFMTALSTLLLCLAAPAALAGRASQRPLRRSAVAFNDCCKGSDIDMPKFLRAAKQYCEIAAQFGRFAVPSASEVRRCIEKIEQAAHKLGGKGSTNYKTMRALLQAEVALQHAQSALALRGPCGQPPLQKPTRLIGAALWAQEGSLRRLGA